MKKSISILFFIVIFFGANAQKVDLDKDWFNFQYTSLPKFVLDNSYTTYSVDISKTLALQTYSNQAIESKINIGGRKKVSNKGHIIIYIKLDDLIIEKSDVKERVEVEKDKNGKETGRRYYYHIEVIYSFNATARIEDYLGKYITNYGLADRFYKQTYTSSEFPNYNDASNYYNNNLLAIESQLISQQIDNVLTNLNTNLNDDFGYCHLSYRDYFWTLGSKKHPEYTDYQNACTKAKAAIETITAEEIPARVFDDLKPSIDYFVALPAKYSNLEEKTEKKLRYGAYFNLAEIYFYLEQFDKAAEYANKLIANDYDTKDGEKMLKLYDETRKELEKNQLNSRHFKRDIENAQPPQ